MTYGRVGRHALPPRRRRQRRCIRRLEREPTSCVTVTLRSTGWSSHALAMHHSMNYRCVVLYGRCRAVDGEAEKRRAFDAVVEHSVTGRERGRASRQRPRAWQQDPGAARTRRRGVGEGARRRPGRRPRGPRAAGLGRGDPRAAGAGRAGGGPRHGHASTVALEVTEVGLLRVALDVDLDLAVGVAGDEVGHALHAKGCGGRSRSAPTSTGCATSRRRSRGWRRMRMKVFPTTSSTRRRPWAAG